MSKYTKVSSIILTSASVLVLSACLPQDEAVLSERAQQQVESQIQLYSKAFQQYSGRSINAIVNSAAWQTASLPEGAVDLATMAPDLNLGTAGAYLSSGHCPGVDGPYHLTWFSKADADGNLSLKGLGRSYVGQTNMRIKSMMSHGNFGIYDGTNINMVGGTTFTLSGGCTTIDMPVGTAVSAISMKIPENIATPIETRTILKAEACPTGQTGGITESISADFYAETISGTTDSKVTIGASNYRDEADAVANHTSGWSVISNNCIDDVEVAMLTSNTDTVDVVSVSALAALNADIQQAIQQELTGVDCRVVGEDDGNGDIEQGTKAFDTCDGSVDLDGLDNNGITEKTLLSSTEDFVENSCPSIVTGTQNVTTSGSDYSTLPSNLRNESAQMNISSLSGTVEVTKIIKSWQVLTDLGNGIPSNPDNADGTCKPNVPECKNETTIDYVGKDINCSGTNTLKFSCADAYNSYKIDTSANNVGPTYGRATEINGWDDADTLKPKDLQYQSSGWTYNSSIAMSCSLIDKRTIGGCKKKKQEREWTSTGMNQTPNWTEWHTVSTDNDCNKTVSFSSGSTTTSTTYAVELGLMDGGSTTVNIYADTQAKAFASAQATLQHNLDNGFSSGSISEHVDDQNATFNASTGELKNEADNEKDENWSVYEG